MVVAWLAACLAFHSCVPLVKVTTPAEVPLVTKKLEIIAKALELKVASRNLDVKDHGALSAFACAYKEYQAGAEQGSLSTDHATRLQAFAEVEIAKNMEACMRECEGLQQKAIRFYEEKLKESHAKLLPISGGAKQAEKKWHESAKGDSLAALGSAAKASIGTSGVVRELKAALTTVNQVFPESKNPKKPKAKRSKRNHVKPRGLDPEDVKRGPKEESFLVIVQVPL